MPAWLQAPSKAHYALLLAIAIASWRRAGSVGGCLLKDFRVVLINTQLHIRGVQKIRKVTFELAPKLIPFLLAILSDI